MSQKTMNIISYSPILKCQFNLTQCVRGIPKSRSVFTTKSNGGFFTTSWIHVYSREMISAKSWIHAWDFAWTFTWFHGARNFTWNNFTSIHVHGITKKSTWIPPLHFIKKEEGWQSAQLACTVFHNIRHDISQLDMVYYRMYKRFQFFFSK